MKLFIDVKDEAERDRIAAALCDPAIRALVNVMGALQPLTQVQQARVLNDVARELKIPL